MSLKHATSSRIMSSEGIMIYHIIYGLLPLIPKHPKLEVDGETGVCTAPSLDRIPKLWLGTPNVSCGGGAWLFSYHESIK